MSSRRDDPEPSSTRKRPRPEAWGPEPEVASASGGHLTPDMPATGPLFEGMAPETPTRAEPPVRDAPPRRGTAQSRKVAARRAQRPLARRVKRTVKHVNPWSVFKMSLFFYGLGTIAWLILVAILYSFVNSMGVFNAIEDFSEGFAYDWNVDITLFFVEKWALLIGVIGWIGGSLVNLLIAFLYNVGADAFGGIEMIFVEKDS